MLKDYFRKLRKERGWTQEQMGQALGFTGRKAIQIGQEVENAGPQWEKHFLIFRKLVTKVDPLALFDEPIDADIMWHYFYLLIHTRVPHELRNSAWSRLREKAQNIIEDESKGIDNPTSKAAKPKRIGKAKARS